MGNDHRTKLTRDTTDPRAAQREEIWKPTDGRTPGIQQKRGILKRFQVTSGSGFTPRSRKSPPNMPSLHLSWKYWTTSGSGGRLALESPHTSTASTLGHIRKIFQGVFFICYNPREGDYKSSSHCAWPFQGGGMDTRRTTRLTSLFSWMIYIQNGLRRRD